MISAIVCRFSLRTLLTALGLALLLLWASWWGASLHKGRLVKARGTWIPAYQFLHVDFLHNYHAACHWLAGGNPYEEPFGCPLGLPFAYPPAVIPLFAWCGLVSVWTAQLIWTALLAAVAAGGAGSSWHTRRLLGLGNTPLALTVALTLGCTPVLFALERGNCDLLVLLLILCGLPALAGRSVWADVWVAACFALAAWIKIYPGLLVLGLLAFRRHRAVAYFVLIAAAIGLAALSAIQQFVRNLSIDVLRSEPTAYGYVDRSVHTLSGCWPLLWQGTLVARLPGEAAWLLIFLPLIAWVSWHVWRLPDSSGLRYPYLLWLIAAGTFLPRIANDYNLFFLPLAALAVWDRRDPLIVHLLMAALLVWWQPFYLPVPARLLFAFKVLGMVGVALSLVQRCRENRERICSPDVVLGPVLACAAG